MAGNLMQRIFGNTPQQQPNQQAPNQFQSAPNQTTPGNQSTEPNGTIPPGANNGDNNNSSTEKKPESPLAKFEGLWETDPNKKQEPEISFLQSIKPEDISAAASKANFLQGNITQEQMKAITEGGEAGTAALLDIVNKVGQASYAQAAMAASKLGDKAIEEAMKKMQDKAPEQTRTLLAKNKLLESNPAYSHPAATPIVELIQKQMAVKHPEATPDELATLSQEYFSNSLHAITGTKPGSGEGNQQSNDNQEEETDWSKELGLS